MQRRLILLTMMALTLLCGCRLFERDRDRTRPLPGEDSPYGGKTKPSGNWLDGPVGMGGKKGKTLDEKNAPNALDPKFDIAKETRSGLGGIVLDPDERPAKNVIVEYELADGSDGPGAIQDTLTNDQGRFQIQGLKPQREYILTARASIQGKKVAGRITAPTSSKNSQQLRIALLEGLNLPSISTGPVGDMPDRPKPIIPNSRRPFDPPDTSIPNPPSVLPGGRPSNFTPTGTDLPMPRSSTDIREQDWSPTTYPGNSNAPTVPTLPPMNRPEMRTDGPANPFRPPVTNIPSQSRSVPLKRSSPFLLVDAMNVEREFPTGRAREFVLLDFMTTTCIPCKKAIPMLKELQADYAPKGLEVIAVVCDDTSLAQRQNAIPDYSRANRLPYRMATEPANRPGALLDRYDIKSYPTLVLLNGEGQQLWQGNPSERRDLEAVLLRESRR
jgi:thiol-disulfide isomerase/thioredoxin